MIRRIAVQGFKALWKVEIELGRLNVFIGPNGAGKTSLLEAIGLLSAAMQGRVDSEALARRGVRLGQPAVYKTALQPQVGALPRYIRLAADDGTYCYRVALDNPIRKPEKAWRFANEWFGLCSARRALVSRSPRSAGQNPARGVVAATPLLEGRALREALVAYRVFAPQTPMLRGIMPDPSAAEPVGLAGGGLAAAVADWRRRDPGGWQRSVEVLRQWFDWVAAVEVLPSAQLPIPPQLPMTRQVLVFTDRYARAGRNRMTAYDASEGVLHALFLLVLAGHPDAPPVAAVDNVGYGLHPRLKRALMRHLAEYLLAHDGPQLLLTTHDPLLLDGLPLQNDQVRLFVTERDAQGRVQIRRVEVTPELWQEKEARGMTVSDLWVEGWLGGVPAIW